MPPDARLVVLGASNVSLGQRALLRAVLSRRQAPVELLLADGFGRSYGLTSSVAGRSLPAILQCGLWQALERREGRVEALVTDVGNDLLYGADVPAIAGWVAEALARLRARGATVVLAGLPLASLARLGPLRFGLLRRLFYPPSRLRFAQLRAQAPALDQALRTLAAQAGSAFVEPRPEWYGLDPVHVRPRGRQRAFEALLSPLPGGRRGAPLPALPSTARLLALPPERRWLFGRERLRQQPALRLVDGSTVALY